MAIQFAYGTAFSSFFILPKYLLQGLHAEPALVGNAHGAFALTGVLLTPFIGSTLDRIGRRPVLLFGLVIGVLSFGLFGFVQSTFAILGLRLLHGLSFACVFNAGSALCIDLAPAERRAEAIGYFGTAMLSTNGFGPWLSEVLADRFDWSVAFLACSVYSFIALGLALFVPKQDVSSKRSAGGSGLTLGVLTACLGGTALGIGVGTSKTFIPSLLVDAGIDRVAPYFVSYTAGALLQRTVFGALPDRLGHVLASRVALLLYAAALFLVVPVPANWVLYLGFFIGVAHGMGYPALGALAITLGPSDSRGRMTAWTTGGFNLGFAISTAGFGRLADSLGYRGLLLCGGACLLLAAVVVPGMAKRYRVEA